MDELNLSLPGIDQLDLDSFEVPYIARNEGEHVLQGCSCDHGILMLAEVHRFLIVSRQAGRLKREVPPGDGIDDCQQALPLGSGQFVVVLDLEQCVGRSSPVGDDHWPVVGGLLGASEVARKVSC
jgi:hypothetical protein